MPIEPIIPGLLYSATRPGHPSKKVGEAEVEHWCAEAKELRIRTIVCLLDDKQLPFYSTVTGGLLGYYRGAKFDVIHRPTKDHTKVGEELLSLIYSDFLMAEKPVLVHCSAGQGRTREVIGYLQENKAIPLWSKADELIRCYGEGGEGRPQKHFRQVARLALKLYDLLAAKHDLAPRYRTVLWAAAYLHGIGTDPGLGSNPGPDAGPSADRILKEGIQCPLASKLEVATVASLHSLEGAGESMPVENARNVVRDIWAPAEVPQELLILARILRVADGLDREMDGSVNDVRLEGDEIVIQGEESSFCQNAASAWEKSGLLTEVLGVRIRTKRVPRAPAIVHAPILFLDFLGTIIHHETHVALPMLRFMINGLRKGGYRVVVLTAYRLDVAREMAMRAGLGDLEIHSTQNRGKKVREILDAVPGTTRAHYVDDKPDGLRSVLEAEIECLGGRVLGFTGSRKYCRPGIGETDIATWCQGHGVSLALSPYDIFCRLPEYFCRHRNYLLVEEYVEENPDLDPEGLGFLVPGLAHPFSDGGDAERVLGTLVERNRNDWPPVWKNLGWIGCCKCQCKIMVRSSLVSLGMDADLILKGSYYAEEHIAAVNRLPCNDRRRVTARLRDVRSLMNEGLRQIGPAAEDCRPAGAEGTWERNRMERLDAELLSKLDGWH